MNGGFIFFFPDKLYFLTFTFQVYGAKKENILVMFPYWKQSRDVRD